MGSQFLFIIACSNHKKSGGLSQYEKQNSILGSLSKQDKKKLLEYRELVFEFIKDGYFNRSGKELKDLPYNSDLVRGIDFGHSEKSSYLPAFQRYDGSLYREIDGSVWEKRNAHLLIISGLYGLLLPEDSIQLYSLHVGDSANISDHWEKELTPFIQAYVARNKIKTIVDATADEAYSNLIKWDELKKSSNIFSVTGEQNIGPALLVSIGEFLAKAGMVLSDSELDRIICQENVFQTRHENIYFQKKDDLLQSPDYLTSLSKTRYSSLEVREAKADYQARSKFHGFEVVFQLKVVEKMAELPKKIRNKIPKVIIQVIKNPGNPGLGYEESVVGKHKIIRCRIDLKHRIHFEPLEKNAKRLIVRDIGGHRLEGIGD